MSQVDLLSPPDDAPVTIDLEAAISADPDSPEGIGEILIGLATCAEHYGHHRVIAASRRNSEGEKMEERMAMERCLETAKQWLDEASPRLKRLKSDVIKDRIPEAGPFLREAGKFAEKLYAYMQFDWTMLPQLRRIALESYKRPGDPGWDPLDNSLRKFRDDAGAVRSRLERLAATLRDSYANNLRQVATSRIETENVDEESSQSTTKAAQGTVGAGNSPSDETVGGEASEQDRLITVREASEIWDRGESHWREQIGEEGEGKPILLRGRGNHRAKLFSFLDAERYAKNHNPPIERRKPTSS